MTAFVFSTDAISPFLIAGVRNAKTEVAMPINASIECYQANAKQPEFFSNLNLSGCAKTAPLDESDGSVQLETRTATEVALRVEMGVDHDEFHIVRNRLKQSMLRSRRPNI
jgi:hypothetical protein